MFNKLSCLIIAFTSILFASCVGGGGGGGDDEASGVSVIPTALQGSWTRSDLGNSEEDSCESRDFDDDGDNDGSQSATYQVTAGSVIYSWNKYAVNEDCSGSIDYSDSLEVIVVSGEGTGTTASGKLEVTKRYRTIHTAEGKAMLEADGTVCGLTSWVVGTKYEYDQNSFKCLNEEGNNDELEGEMSFEFRDSISTVANNFWFEMEKKDDGAALYLSDEEASLGDEENLNALVR